MFDSQKNGFIVKPFRAKYLETYYKNMSQDSEHIIFDDNVATVLASQGFSAQESPRSVYRVDKLFEALNKFAPNRISDPIVSDHLKAGIALARTCFVRQKDDPILSALSFSIGSIHKITSNPSASAGLTNYGFSKSVSEVRAYERGLETLQGKKASEPCLAFARTQFNEKTRLVWGYPFSMTAIEGIIARPLIDQFKKGFTPLAFAMSTGKLGAHLRVGSYKKDFAYSLDMSSYDSSVSQYLIHLAFDIIETWFDKTQIVHDSGITVGDVFKQIRGYFIHTPIVMPDGNIYRGKKHGVPSGSYFTQLVDSIVNVIICGTVASRFSMHVDKSDILVLGDDLIFWSNRRIDLLTLANFASCEFGVTFNSEKSKRFDYNEVIHFLGRDWDNGIPDLPVEDILMRAVYPERFRKYSKDEVEREREVALLLFSYATVYKSAWWLLNQIYDARGARWDHSPSDIDHHIRRHKDQVVSSHLSGLMRYNMIFKTKLGTGFVAFPILFWQ